VEITPRSAPPRNWDALETLAIAPLPADGRSKLTAALNIATDENPAGILLTVEEAAERLRIGRTLMYSLIKTGEIESVPVGRLRRIPAECIGEYIARLRSANRQNSPAA
jgi:excisionase family DNA binding protein